MQITNIANLNESIELKGTYSRGNLNYGWKFQITWHEIFEHISPYILQKPPGNVVKDMLGIAMQKAAGVEGYGFELEDQVFRTVEIQFQALGLVSIDVEKSGISPRWKLTSAGEALMFELRTIRSTTSGG